MFELVTIRRIMCLRVRRVVTSWATAQSLHSIANASSGCVAFLYRGFEGFEQVNLLWLCVADFKASGCPGSLGIGASGNVP